MILQLHDFVEDDLARGYEFYEEIESGTGDYFLTSIVKDIRELESYKQDFRNKQFGFFRKLGSDFPFAIYYEFQEDPLTVIVFAILPMKADPVWIKKQMAGR